MKIKGADTDDQDLPKPILVKKKLSPIAPEDPDELKSWKDDIKTSIYQVASQRLMKECIVKLCGNECHGKEDSERKIGISAETGGICMECYKYYFKIMVETTVLEDQFKNNPFNIILSHTNHYCASLAKHISESVDNDRFAIETDGEDNLKISLEPAEKEEISLDA